MRSMELCNPASPQGSGINIITVSPQTHFQTLHSLILPGQAGPAHRDEVLWLAQCNHKGMAQLGPHATAQSQGHAAALGPGWAISMWLDWTLAGTSTAS